MLRQKLSKANLIVDRKSIVGKLKSQNFGFSFKLLSKNFHVKGEAEDVLQMQGKDERREDNTAGEEETTLTTSTQVSLWILSIFVRHWIKEEKKGSQKHP